MGPTPGCASCPQSVPPRQTTGRDGHSLPLELPPRARILRMVSSEPCLARRRLLPPSCSLTATLSYYSISKICMINKRTCSPPTDDSLPSPMITGWTNRRHSSRHFFFPCIQLLRPASSRLLTWARTSAQLTPTSRRLFRKLSSMPFISSRTSRQRSPTRLPPGRDFDPPAQHYYYYPPHYPPLLTTSLPFSPSLRKWLTCSFPERGAEEDGSNVASRPLRLWTG
jgi:hypothetical protein